MTSSYPIPARALTVEQEIKRSRFVTDIGPAANKEQALAFIERIKREHPEARHHCWAYIAGHPQQSIERACSDAGEPQGTAGKPMLNVLQHKGIGEIVVVVSRYFGGIKLGAGGLVRAYGASVQQAVDALSLNQRVAVMPAIMTLPFALESHIRRQLERLNITILQCDYGSSVTLRVEVPLGQEDALQQAITNTSHGAVTVHFP